MCSLKLSLLLLCFFIVCYADDTCPRTAGLEDQCEYEDENGDTKYVPHNESDCGKYSECCWNAIDQICRPKINNVTFNTGDGSNPFSRPDPRKVDAAISARHLVLNPLCAKPMPFPSGCKYRRDELYVLDPPTDIPYCVRIPCSLDQVEQKVLDGNHFKCGSTPGCYFDVELYEYRQHFPAVLAGVPVCHLAIRNSVFLREARKVQNDLGSWNPYFTNCLLKTFRDEIHTEVEGCGLIPLMMEFNFYPKIAGWDTITRPECRLIGACWSPRHGCRYPVDINNLIVRSGQRFVFTEFDVVYGRPKCQHFNTDSPYEILKSYHICLASGCAVDYSISSHYFHYLFDIGEQMTVKDHWYYWAAVMKGDIGPFNLDTDIYWPYDKTFSRSLGGGGPEPPIEDQTEPTDKKNPFAPPVFGRNRRQAELFGRSSACGFVFKAQGYRPCRPKPPKELKTNTRCPYKQFSVPRFKDLRGSFYGCCEVNLCFISRKDIRKMNSGPSLYYIWTSWTECTHTCGSGKQTRTRKCVSHNKDLCDSDITQTRPCPYIQECGEWTEWGPWLPCPTEYVYPCPTTQRFRLCLPNKKGCEGRGSSEQSMNCPVCS